MTRAFCRFHHVVLHHPSTSAIENGVLAVADTVRYKKSTGGYFISYFIFGFFHCDLGSYLTDFDPQFITMIYLRGAVEGQ